MTEVSPYMKFAELDFNEEFVAAFEAMEHTGEHMFITGKAGTGKSTLLQYFRQKTAKKVAFLAPTGVAAINIKGQTIHSFFGFKPDVTPEQSVIYRCANAGVKCTSSLRRSLLTKYPWYGQTFWIAWIFSCVFMGLMMRGLSAAYR